jgi:beta-glucosidase
VPSVEDLAEELLDVDTNEVGGMAPGGDRSSLRLSDDDEALIAAAAAMSPNVAVVVQCGSAVMMPWADSVRAVLVTWYPGVEGGNALGDIVTGSAEPSGRLPFAIPTDEAHLVHFDRNATTETYGLLHGQWKLDADGNPAHFPFGAGRGYSTFVLGDAVLSDDGSAVTVEVSNASERAGSTVVFVTAGVDESTVDRPGQRLIGFRRVFAAPAETTTVRIDLDWEQLDVRRNGHWWTEPATYRIRLGQDADDVAVELTVSR